MRMMLRPPVLSRPGSRSGHGQPPGPRQRADAQQDVRAGQAGRTERFVPFAPGVSPTADFNDPVRVGEKMIVAGIGVGVHEAGILREYLGGALLAPVLGEIEETIRRTAAADVDPHPRFFRSAQPFLEQVHR